jgi:hypothetical protein
MGVVNLANFYIKKNDKEATIGCGCFFLWLLLALGFWGTVIWVAAHFIAKFW